MGSSTLRKWNVVFHSQRLWLWLTSRHVHAHGQQNGVGHTYVRPSLARPLQRLQENLKWMEDAKEVKHCVNTESNLAVSTKLDTLGNLKKLSKHASSQEIQQYIVRNLSILDQMLPLIRNCTPEFKHTYLMDNAFVRYVVALCVTYRNNLPKETLEMAIQFVMVIEAPAIYDSLFRLIDALRSIPGTLHSCIGHLNNLLLLVHNTDNILDSQEIYEVGRQLVFDVVATSIDINGVGVMLSVLNLLRQRYPDDEYLLDITSAYMHEVKHRLFVLEPSALLNVLQFMYRCTYVDDGLYTKTMEALLYKYDLMSFEEKSTLLLLLPFLKHVYLLSTPNITTNIYSEECQMLNAMLRREFENEIEYMPFDDMITHCLAISLMFKQSSVIRKILLKTIDNVMIESINARTFLKLLSCCNTVYITSSSVDVSRLLSKVAHTKLAACSGPELLHGFKSLAQIVARRHRKYLVPLVHDVLQKNKSDCMAIIECLHLYIALQLQRTNLNILETGFVLLFPHMKSQIDGGSNMSASPLTNIDLIVKNVGGNLLLSHSDKESVDISETTGLGNMASVTKPLKHGSHKKDMDVLYIDKSESTVETIPLSGLIKLLECLTKMELELSRMAPIFSLLQTSILRKIKYNSNVSFHDLSEVLRSLTDSRVICSELADVILDRVYNCPERLDDPECAAIILRFIEFTNHGDYASKLSQPLFEFCLRKCTPALVEVLEYQQYKRPEFHAAYLDLMRPVSTEVADGFGGMIKHSPVMADDFDVLLRSVKLPRSTTGKNHQLLAELLTTYSKGEHFEEHYKIDNIVVDFFYPNLCTAVQILRSQDCYYDGEWVHIKSRMWLLCEILRLKGIRVILIPERGLKTVPESAVIHTPTEE
ncbi:complex i intermediate-associated, putative [Babesia ovis]|uniref:Complex i intermediate-associated, putative n=1 Tax=Babesia ovis TaxID=5869 RepID=A0A9W5WTH8_BABOV|nr:complex i intermediate-associated, putative [Babesia ovis]